MIDQAIVGASVEFSALDRSLANLLARRDGSPSAALVGATAALLSSERSRGHACVDLSQWQGRDLGDAGWRGAAVRLPDAGQWQRALLESPAAGDGSTPTPIVVEAGRCYLYRYWNAERRVAERLRLRAENKTSPRVSDDLRRVFDSLFPGAAAAALDRQALAAAIALASNLTIVSGGPGTGKTTVAARTLLLMLAAQPAARIALVAPTGKAAARLGESLERELASLDAFPDLTVSVPRRAMTVHRLLGRRTRGRAFRYDTSRPLAADVVVVDEASMLDLLLADALLDALLPGAKLILLGDRYQLASVETGVVFSDLCAVAVESGATANAGADTGDPARLPPRGAASAALYHKLCGVELPSSGEVHALADGFVELTENHRFAAGSGIARLAECIRRGDAEAVLSLLDDPAASDVSRLRPDVLASQLDAWLGDWVAACLQADGPLEALERLAERRMLCALRRGPWGVEAMNRLIEHRYDLTAVGEAFYRGKPLLVTTNDYRQGLFNGDVGVVWTDHERVSAHFASDDDGEGTRGVVPALLPPHETAWAMTVHKSQGSEFDRVTLVLPREDSPVLTRELLYTGVTRARSEVLLVADEATVRCTVERAHGRASGLAQRLLVPVR